MRTAGERMRSKRRAPRSGASSWRSERTYLFRLVDTPRSRRNCPLSHPPSVSPFSYSCLCCAFLPSSPRTEIDRYSTTLLHASIHLNGSKRPVDSATTTTTTNMNGQHRTRLHDSAANENQNDEMMRPRVLPLASRGTCAPPKAPAGPSSSSSLFVASSKGIPWDLLVPVAGQPRTTGPEGGVPNTSRPATAARLPSTTLWDEREHHKVGAREGGGSPAGDLAMYYKGSGTLRETRQAAQSSQDSLVFPSRRVRPNLDGFAFQSLVSNSSMSQSQQPPHYQDPTEPLYAHSSPLMTTSSSPQARSSAALPPALRHPLASLSYYTSATQPYNCQPPPPGARDAPDVHAQEAPHSNVDASRDAGSVASDSTAPPLPPPASAADVPKSSRELVLQDDGRQTETLSLRCDPATLTSAPVGSEPPIETERRTPTPTASKADAGVQKDEPEVETVEEITSARGVDSAAQRRERYSQRMATPVVPSKPTSSNSVVSEATDAPTRSGASRLARGRSTSRNAAYNRTASLTEGRPLYPHLREQQNLHTRGLVRLPSPATPSRLSQHSTRNQSISPSGRPVTSFASSSGRSPRHHRRTPSVVPSDPRGRHQSPHLDHSQSPTGATQRSAQWLSRLLEDCMHQCARQHQQGQLQPPAGSRPSPHAQRQPSSALAEPMSVPEVFSRFLLARYGTGRWQAILDEAATALYRYHNICPLIAIFRRYFTTPATSVSPVAGVVGGPREAKEKEKAEEESDASTIAARNFLYFCDFKDRCARLTLTAKQHARLGADEGTLVSRRYLRLHNLAVELTEVLEAVTIAEVVVVSPQSSSLAKRARGARRAGEEAGLLEQPWQQQQEPKRSYYLHISEDGRRLLRDDASSSTDPTIVTLLRRLRPREVTAILDLVLAWIDDGTQRTDATKTPYDVDDANHHNALAFDKPDCVDADAAAQALVEAMNVVCCLHRGEALAKHSFTERPQAQQPQPQDERSHRRVDEPQQSFKSTQSQNGSDFTHPQDASPPAVAPEAEPETVQRSGALPRPPPHEVHAVRTAETESSTVRLESENAECIPDTQASSVLPPPAYLGHLSHFHEIVTRHSARRPARQDAAPSCDSRESPTNPGPQRTVLWSRHAVASSATAPVPIEREIENEPFPVPPTPRSAPAPLTPSLPPPHPRASTPSPSEVEKEMACRDGKRQDNPRREAESARDSLNSPVREADEQTRKPLRFDESSLLESTHHATDVTTTRSEERSPSPYVLRHALRVSTAPQQRLAQTMASLEADLMEKKRRRTPMAGEDGAGGKGLAPMVPRADTNECKEEHRLFQRLRAPIDGSEPAREQRLQREDRAASTVTNTAEAEESAALADLDKVLKLLRERRSRTAQLVPR